MALYASGQVLGQQQFKVTEDMAVKQRAGSVAPLLAQPMRTHPTVGTTFQDCNECPKMVVLPAGSFTMGATEMEWADSFVGDPVKQKWARDRYSQESPRHKVTIGHAFAVGIYPVTRKEFREFAAESGYTTSYHGNSGFAKNGTRPVAGMNWKDVQAYVKWLSQKTGRQYRVLSEAEYEYAERAGTTTAYWWGSKEDDVCNFALSYGCTCGFKQVPGCTDFEIAPVGKYPANAFGLYDMTGNVYEWVEDCWHDSYRGAPTDGSAWTNGDCSVRVMRGFSYSTGSFWRRSAAREKVKLSESRFWLGDTGFRVARDLWRPCFLSLRFFGVPRIKPQKESEFEPILMIPSTMTPSVGTGPLAPASTIVLAQKSGLKRKSTNGCCSTNSQVVRFYGHIRWDFTQRKHRGCDSECNRKRNESVLHTEPMVKWTLGGISGVRGGVAGLNYVFVIDIVSASRWAGAE